MLAASLDPGTRAGGFTQSSQVDPSIRQSFLHLCAASFELIPGVLRIPASFIFRICGALCERCLCLIFARARSREYILIIRAPTMIHSTSRKLVEALLYERGSSQSFSRRMRPMEFRVAYRIMRRACGRHKVARAMHITRAIVNDVVFTNLERHNFHRCVRSIFTRGLFEMSLDTPCFNPGSRFYSQKYSRASRGRDRGTPKTLL